MKKNKRFPALVALGFLVLFLLGLANTGEYGMPWDEKTEQGILTANVKEYVYALGGGGGEGGGRTGILAIPAVARVLDSEVPRISENVEKDHGMAACYPALPLMALPGLSPLQKMHLWHGYLWCFCFLGTLGMYFLLKELFSRRWVHILGTVLWYCTPRFFAESHYNNKDMVFVTLLVLSLCFAVRAAKRLKWRDVLLFSLSSGFLMNSRILGAALWGLCGIFFLGYQGLRKRKAKEWAWKTAAAAALSLLVWGLVTPAMWGDPVGFVRYCLENAGHFSRYNSSFLFAGRVLRPAGEGVPYDYLVRWMLMTTPGVVLLLLAASLAAGITRLLRKNRKEGEKEEKEQPEEKDRTFFLLQLLCMFLLPFAYLVAKSPTLVLYNGWRHCYFLYPLLFPASLFCLDTVDFSVLAPRKAARLPAGPSASPSGSPSPRPTLLSRAAAGLLAATAAMGLASVQLDMALNRSYEYVYMNRAARLAGAMEENTGDYWNVSVMPLVKEFKKQQKEPARLCLAGDAAGGQDLSLLEGEGIQFVPEEEADYMVINRSTLEDKSVTEGLREVFALRKFGTVISGIYTGR